VTPERRYPGAAIRVTTVVDGGRGRTRAWDSGSHP
jgi:hypothetical protein